MFEKSPRSQREWETRVFGKSPYSQREWETRTRARLVWSFVGGDADATVVCRSVSVSLTKKTPTHNTGATPQ